MILSSSNYAQKRDLTLSNDNKNNTKTIKTYRNRGNWSDLYEDDKKIYGSEKEEKYSINAFIVEKENWEDHNALMILFFYKSKNYPMYTSLRVAPFYFNLRSKVDNRKYTLIPLPFGYYNEIDGPEDFTLFFPFYYSNIKKTEEDRNILYLFWWGNSSYYNRNKSYQTILPLLFYHSSFSYKNSSREGSFWISPFFLSVYEKYVRGKGAKTFRLNFSLFHFYSSNINKSSSLNSKLWFFPIIPIVYRNTNNSRGHQNILWLIDYSWKRNNLGVEKLKRLWIAPLIFWERGQNGYTHVLPPLFIYSKWATGEYYVNIFPLFFRKKSIDKRYSYKLRAYKKTYKDSIVTPLYSSFAKYRGTNGWEENVFESTTWLPIIPLFYSSYHREEGTHRNLLWLIDWASDNKGNLERFWFMPLLFHEVGKGGYTHVLPPLIMTTRNKSGRTFKLFIPFYLGLKSIGHKYIYHNNRSETIEEYIDTDISLAGVSHETFRDKEKKWDGEPFISRFWFPIIPLYYSYNHKNKGSHTNLLWLVDWSRKRNGTLNRFWFMPFVFHRFGSNGYSHVLPPVIITMKWKNGETYKHVLPLYMGWKSKKKYYNRKEKKYKNEYSDTNISLLFVSRDTTRDEKRWKGKPYKSHFWFPIIPLYYSYSHNREGTHRNLLWLFDWHSNTGGELERFFFIPLVFHKPGISGYKYYIPFYFRPSGATEKKGYSFGIFHYHRWSESERILWALPFYSWKEHKSKKHLTLGIPLYYSWKLKKSTGRVIFPIYIAYEDSKTDFVFAIPLVSSLGFSISSLWLEKYKNTWHLDTDFSFLFGAFEVGFRVPIKNPFKKSRKIEPNVFPEKIEEIDEKNIDIGKKNRIKPLGLKNSKTGVAIKKENKPRLESKSTLTRETSHTYFGWQFLWGVVSYKATDSERHFRMLPLCYLTYNENSSDKIFWVLNFIYFKSDKGDLVYNALFPFYGYQVKKKSHIIAVLINLYWKEYYADENLNEHTVLWPIFNLYYSPKKSGWRVLPIIWHGEYQKKKIHTSKYISLLHYSHIKTDIKTGSTVHRTILSPLFYSGKRTKGDGVSKLTLIPIIPLYFSSYEKKAHVHRDEIKAPVEGNRIIKAGLFKTDIIKNERKVSPLKYTVQKRSFIIPLGYDSEKKLISENGNVTSDYMLLGLPLLYYHSNSSFNKNDGDNIKSKEYSFFLLGFYRHRSLYKTETSFLYNFISVETMHKSKRSTYSFLFGLLRSSGGKSYRRLWFLPFFYYYNSSSEFHINVLGLMDRAKSENYKRAFVLPFFYTSTHENLTHNNILGFVDWAGNNSGYSRVWVLPIFVYETQNLGSKGLIVPIVTGWNTKQDYTRILLFGLFWYQKFKSQNITNIHVAPFFFSFRSPNKSKYVILGTYWYNSRTYSRQNIFYLFDHVNYRGIESETYDLIFGCVRYKISPRIRQIRLFYSLLMNYENSLNSRDFDLSFLMYLSRFQRRGNSLHHRVLPLWYYQSYKNGKDYYLLIPPILSYFSKNEEGYFDLGLLGIAYYRNSNVYERSDRKMVLLGTLWNEVKRPERGYHSRGMFWGILWDYETERKDDFEKFSILKGLYKHVKKNGKVQKRRMLWFIPLPK
ncbi:LA_1737 family protein [Spirochaetota bacterium]